MTRRFLVLGSLVAITAAAEDGVLEVFEPLASALSAGDLEGFLKPFDRKMADLAVLRETISALIARFDITSSIELLRSAPAKVELDWYLELHSKEAAGVSERRRQTVTATVEKKRILSIAPLQFFAPTANWK